MNRLEELKKARKDGTLEVKVQGTSRWDYWRGSILIEFCVYKIGNLLYRLESGQIKTHEVK